MSILETTRYGTSAKILGHHWAPLLTQGANFDSSAPMALGKSLHHDVRLKATTRSVFSIYIFKLVLMSLRKLPLRWTQMNIQIS